jgi:hypothetical protein
MAQVATPRRVVATECGAAALITSVAVVLFGATPWAFALLAVCLMGMAPAFVVAGRVERGGARD